MPPFCGAISRKGPLAPDIKHRLKTLTAPQQQSCLRNDSPDGLFTGFASQILAGEGKASCEIPEYSVLFNGILYNHKDLLPLLPENSRALAEKSTPLLIAHLFHKYNHACFSRLNGVFSLALRDIPHRTFYLVNGKLQPRKIYYFFYEECLFFTEDMENIIKISGIRPSVNITFLPKYFTYGFVPSPNTLLEGIHRLPSGKFLLFEPDNMDLQTYWDIQFNDQNETSTIAKETHYSEEVFRVLSQSAERRLNADSRTGLFLSGGLDSSSLVAALKHISPGIPLQTFTAVFDEKSFNEAPKARTVASFFQTQHHEILFTPQKALTFVKDWIKEVDDPFSDDDIICGGVLSPIAEELVNDVFLGDGPDELFMGYPSFLAHRLTDIYGSVPALFRKCFEKGISLLPVSYQYCAFDTRFKQFLGGLGCPPALRDAAWWGPFPPVNQKPLFPEDRHILLRFEYPDVYQDVLESQRRVNARTLVDQVLTAYIKILSERWLMKLNAVGQRTSLQFKTPYLDDDFITCVNRIPGRYKLKAKYILRKGMGPHLPQRIARQEKRPFFVPLALWLKDDFKELLSDILTAENIRQAGLNHKTILKMCHEHFSGKKNNAKQIWNLFILIAWHRKVKTISGR